MKRVKGINNKGKMSLKRVLSLMLAVLIVISSTPLYSTNVYADDFIEDIQELQDEITDLGELEYAVEEEVVFNESETVVEEAAFSVSEEVKASEEVKKPGVCEDSVATEETEVKDKYKVYSRLSSGSFLPDKDIEGTTADFSKEYDGIFSDYLADSVSIPSKYDRSNNTSITPVKNQGDFGNCWSFAYNASAEAEYKKMYGETKDFSETHTVNFLLDVDGSADGPDGGLLNDKSIPIGVNPRTGKGVTALNTPGCDYYTRHLGFSWKGPAEEGDSVSNLKYPVPGDYDPDDSATYTIDDKIDDSYAVSANKLHLENSYIISGSGESVQNQAKSAIMEYGTVECFFDCSEMGDSNYVDGFDPHTDPSVYYVPEEVYDNGKELLEASGHIVAIVGWNDNYPKENFSYTKLNSYRINKEFGGSSDVILPNNDGAWLVKNSWGADYGDEGFFWMSYEEASLNSVFYVNDWGAVDNYDHNYQHDGTASPTCVSGRKIEAGSVFTVSEGTQVISAIGFGFDSPDTDYEIKIYKNLSDLNNPESGELMVTKTNRTTFPGLYTIKLSEEETFKVSGYETIGVTVTASRDSKNVIFLVDAYYEDTGYVEYVPYAGRGNSFYKYDGIWVDTGMEENPFVFRIKLFTDNDEEEILATELTKDNFVVEPGVYTGAPVIPKVKATFGTHILKEGKDFVIKSVSANRLVYYGPIEEEGMDTATRSYPNVTIEGIGKYTGTVNIGFNILAKPLTVEMIDVDSLTMAYEYTNNGSNYLTNVEIRDYDRPYGSRPYTKLEKDVDYEIFSEKSITKAGSYNVIIRGMGNYTGSLNSRIKINPYEINESDIRIGLMVNGSFTAITNSYSPKYNSTQIKPVVRVLYRGDSNREISSENYTVSYGKNTEAGVGYVYVTGKANCSQKKLTKTFTIKPDDLSHLPADGSEATDIRFSPATVTYSGKALKPKVNIRVLRNNKVNGGVKVLINTLKEGRDFDVEYSKNVNVGKGNVQITFKGNYAGTKNVDFTIEPYKLSASQMTVELGEQARGRVRLFVYGNKTEINSSQYVAVVKESGTSRTVSRGADGLYQVDPKKKYDVEVMLTSGCNYFLSSPIVKKNVTIKTDVNMATFSAKAENPTDVYVYDGLPKTPAVEAAFEGALLKEGTDYTVVYADNINAGTATAYVKGKGRFSGMKEAFTFEIKKKEIYAQLENVTNCVYTGKEATQKPIVKAVYSNGLEEEQKVLKAGKDYTVTYTGNLVDVHPISGREHKVQIDVSNNYRVTKWIDATDIKFSHDVITANRFAKEFVINPAVITSVKLKNTKVYYDPSESLTPEVVVKAGKLIVPASSYTVSSYNPRLIDAVQVITVKNRETVSNFRDGKDNKVSLKVKKLPAKELKVSRWQVASRSYNGTVQKLDMDNDSFEFITPAGVVINKLNYDEYFDIKYKNCVTPGKKASVIFASKKNAPMSGSITEYFEIKKADITKIGVLTDDCVGTLSYTGKTVKFNLRYLPSYIKQEPTEYKALTPKVFIPRCGIYYRDNKSIGVGTLIIKGKGYYQGTLELPFIIDKATVDNAKVTLNTKNPYYEEGIKKLRVSKVEVSGKALKLNTDYTIEYRANVRPGKNCIIIKGIGNYRGSRIIYFNS